MGASCAQHSYNSKVRDQKQQWVTFLWDSSKKQDIKTYADTQSKNKAVTPSLDLGDAVIVKQLTQQVNNILWPRTTGSRGKADHHITRNSSHFKKVAIELSALPEAEEEEIWKSKNHRNQAQQLH